VSRCYCSRVEDGETITRYLAGADAVKLAKELCARAAEAISLDDRLAPLDMPVIAVVAKVVGEAFGGWGGG